MNLKLFLVIGIVCFQTYAVYGHTEQELQEEFLKFKLNPISRSCKAVQFLAFLASQKGREEDILKVAQGQGVGGVNKNRMANEEEMQIVLNSLYIAKQKVEDFPDIIKNSDKLEIQHKEWLHTAWRVMGANAHLLGKSDFLRDNQLCNRFVDLISLYASSGKKELKSAKSSLDLLYLYNDGVGVTEQYDLSWPCIPLFHPYHPISTGAEDDIKPDSSFFHPGIRLALARSFRKFLPVDIQTALNGLPDQNLDIFFVTQNLPWKDHISILYRPHYWLDPNAPKEQAHYNKAFNVGVRLFMAPRGLTISQNATFNGSVSVHSGGDSGREIVSSPDNFSVDSLLSSHKNGNLALWSLVCNQDTNCWALTLHWILDEKRQEELASMLKGISGQKDGKSMLLDLSKRLDSTSSILRSLYRFGF